MQGPSYQVFKFCYSLCVKSFAVSFSKSQSLFVISYSACFASYHLTYTSSHYVTCTNLGKILLFDLKCYFVIIFFSIWWLIFDLSYLIIRSLFLWVSYLWSFCFLLISPGPHFHLALLSIQITASFCNFSGQNRRQNFIWSKMHFLLRLNAWNTTLDNDNFFNGFNKGKTAPVMSTSVAHPNQALFLHRL